MTKSQREASYDVNATIMFVASLRLERGSIMTSQARNQMLRMQAPCSSLMH